MQKIIENLKNCKQLLSYMVDVIICTFIGILKRSEIKLSIKYFSKPALNFGKRTRPEKDSATRLYLPSL